MFILLVIQQMNKAKLESSAAKAPTTDASKVGDLFTAASLDEYAEISRDDEDDSCNDEAQILD